MEQTITIYCKNTHAYHDVPRGISLIQLKDLLGVQLPYPIIAAHVNYKVENLDFLLYKPKDIEFLDASSPSGMRAYVRTLNMVLACAINGGERAAGSDASNGTSNQDTYASDHCGGQAYL